MFVVRCCSFLRLGFGAVSGPAAKFGMSVFPDGSSLSHSFLMSVSGSQDFSQVPTPTLCMAFYGRVRENHSQGLVFEPAAPSVLVSTF